MDDEANMSAESILCPYCNAAMSLTAADLQERQIRCPRCGDRFRNQRYDPYATAGSPSLPEERAETDAEFSSRIPPSRANNVATARRVLVLMAISAVVAFVFILLTVQFRRSNDPKKKEPILPPKLAQPIELPALGYLPRDCRVVAGWHLQEMRETRQGRVFWKSLRIGRFGPTIAQIEKKTGIRFNEVDHAALGVLVGSGLPQFVLIIRTNQPYDSAKIAKAAGNTKPLSYQNRPVYRIRLKPVGDGLLWLRDHSTIVVHVDPFLAKTEDLARHPKDLQPNSGWSDNPASALVRQLSREMFLWAAGQPSEIQQLDDWLKLLPVLNTDERRQIRSVKAFAVGTRFQKGVTLDGIIDGKDKQSLHGLAKLATASLQTVKKQEPRLVKSFKIIGPIAGKKKVETDLRVTIQVRLRFAEVLDIFARIGQ